jgi:glycosyltransferase involved in cell wall biosynthesis
MSNRKRIAINTRFLLSNRLEGIGYFTLETVKRIVSSHPEVDFYLLFDRKYSHEFIFADNITPVVLYPSARHPILWYVWFEISVSNWLNKHKPDLFFSPDGFGCLRTNIPQLIVMHDLAYEHYKDHVPFLTRTYYKYFMPRFARKATRIVTVSEFSKQDIIKQYHVGSEIIDVVYSGAKEGYRPLSESIKKIVKEKYSQGENYFFFIGSIHPRKNVPRLLQAFDKFKNSTRSQDKLLIAGKKAWDYAEVEDVLAKMNYKDDVKFLGYLHETELIGITSSARCMMFVSLFEGFGVPIIEAMKCEVPVITSEITSMPEIAGDAAILVESIFRKYHLFCNGKNFFRYGASESINQKR